MKNSNFVPGLLAASLGSIALCGTAGALPILNRNAPVSGTTPALLTIYPDHQDQNMFYLVPKSMGIAHDSRGVPLFSYMEIPHFLSTSAVVQVSMAPAFDDSAIDLVEKSILYMNPNAHFAALPFARSRMIFPGQLTDLIESSDCTHDGGVVGSDETCIFRLTPEGRRVLVGAMRARAALFMSLQYTVDGVEDDGKGEYRPTSLTWTIAGDIGGTELGDCPGLFTDENGNPLKFGGGARRGNASCGHPVRPTGRSALFSAP